MAELNALAACPPSLVVTPHPVTLEGQQRIAAELLPRETLGHFLVRTVPDYGSDAWEVRINGVRVPHQIIDKVRPKGGTVIEVRGTVGRTALLIVAMVALTIFTAGVGTAMVAAGYSAMAAGMAQAAIYAVGSLLINKVLGPKKPKQYESDAATVYTIGSARNQARPYEPLPLVLGSIRIAPDIASQPYSFYESNDQFMAMVLTPGINVARVDAMFNGEALLSTFEGVQVWHSGFPRMPEEKIPLYSNVDTLAGGALTAEKGTPSAWVQRTSSPSTIRLQLDFDYMLFDTTSKGKPKDNQETIQVQYRTVGATDWRVFGNFALISQSQKQQRRTYALDVEPGQYEVRARIAGRNTDGSGATSDFTWSTLKSIQTDTASYAGIPRIGIRIKATGQLNGAPDELRCVAYAAPIPVWKGNQWVTEESSNPGAQILAYARGIRDPAGNLIAGLGLLDAQIDIAALQAFMLHCAASKYTYDNVIRDTRSHDDVLQAIALAGFGNVTWAAGRLSVVWAADEQPLSGVVNMATIKKGQFQIDYTLANAADGIEFTYVDRSDWSSKTLRVTAPGVQTMLNPAQVSGEGITTEEHAAKMARYHLAQSLYQYKDISFSTDIEHLSYRRMSVLALQHDLTQWGFGGRLVSATRDGSTVVLTLDDQVRAPATGNSFIGLRIPGELVYRVFRVATFAGETDQIRLADPWPADAPLPGNTDENPAHDTIWIFDFKQTPGYRVRVVGIEPESDLKGASVSVVPEGPEFWRYVESGQYIPAPNGSLLKTRPVASNLRITEQQVVQGDTVFTELSASFDVSGPVGETIVLSDLDRNSELEQVATTRTRTATWRIPQAGVYPITVRPYSPEGNAGVAVTAMYATRGADVPPVLVDVFDVAEISGGVRRYTWGFLNETVQSADFAGVEIRYSPGKVAAPAWDQMTPLGDDGYHVAAFEAVLPPAGEWTFACRSRNTSGALSETSRVVQKTLRANLGEVIGDLVEDLDDQTRKLVEQQRQLDKETVDRILADASEAAARARELGVVNAKLVSEAQTRANQIGQAMDAVAAEGQARATGLLNEKLERQAAVTAESDARQSDVESLSHALSEVAAGSGTQFDSKTIWHFTTTVEGWGSNGGAPALNDGWLRPTNNSASYAQSPAGLGIDGNAYRFIKLRMRRTGNPVWLGLVRWTTEADQAWNDGKSTTIAPPAFDAAGVATVDISDIPWSGPSPIRQLRIALTRGQTLNDYVEYDYIAIGRPAPGASVALVQEERQARVTALAAEASERNTLAVQMRGNYTGSDLSQAQGFVGDERTARVAADSSQVQRITTMEARMPAGNGGLATSASVTTLQDAMVAADQANAEATTAVNSKLNGLRTLGDNMLPNSDFADGVVWWQVGGSPMPVWSGTNGDGKAGFLLDKTGTATNPSLAANSAQWFPSRGIRRYRAVVRARGVSGAMNLMMRLERRNRETGATGTNDKTLMLTTSFASYTIDFDAVDATIGAVRLWAYCWPNVAAIRIDRVELYDVTDQAASELTASGLEALTTRTSSIEGIQTAQATLIGQVQSGLAQTNSNVTAAQQAAQAAADAAGAKGKVIYGPATPVVADRLPQNLWIDSTGNANTPKRWNGTAWAAVSDKVATDAAAAAAAAQQTANAAQSQANANAGALSTLDTKVTQQGAALTALGQAVTTVNAELDGLRTLGDNMLPNSDFADGVVWWQVGGSPMPVWSGTNGDGKAGFLLDKTGTATNPSLAANSAQWFPSRGIRRYRAVVRARGVSGAMNLMMRLERRNRETGATGTNDKTLMLTTSFASYTVDFDAVDATIGAVRLWAYCWPNVAAIRIDRVELYDVTDQLAAEANAAATSTLSGKVTTLEGTTTVQGQAITTVSAGLAQANRSGSNMVVDGSFEGRASGTALAAWAVVGPGGRTGANALAVSGDGVARSTVIQTFDVTPGRTYYAEAWVKRVGSATGGTIQLRGNLSLNGASATYPYFQQLNVSQLNTEDWVKISGKLTIPEGKNQLHFQEYHTGNLVSGQQILWDDFVLLDVTEAAAAQGVADAAATGLSALTTTVTQQGGQITALGQQVNQVGASVAGKADTQVVQTLTAMVKDTMSGGGNLLSNTLFKDGSRGWGWWNSGNGVWNGLGLVAGPEWAPPGLAHFGGFAPSNLALNTQFWAGDEQPVPVVAGKRYCFSAYINCHRVGLALLISFRDANGNTVGEQYSGPADATNVRPPITLERLKRLSASMVAPASAVYARVGYYLRGLGLSNNEGNYFWIFQPMLEEMREGQTGPSPYSAGGGETLAGYSLYVTADGLTGGMVTKNDGKVVDMKILANVLQILSPNQPEGIEMRDGYIRVWKGNSQRIIGTGFGGGDLMDYFGPNVGAGAANKLNATMWMDVNGNAYWGGSLSAGIWKNANRTSSTVANPYVEVGPFAAHGKQRVVVASFSTFSPTYTTWYDGRSSSNEPPPPAIASSTVLRLRRNVGAGLELVSQQAFPASAVLVNLTYHDRDAGIRELPNGGWQQEYYFACSGSFTATEPGSTFQNFIYEGAITTQAIPQIVSQTIAVVSTEEP
ncbi:host specificity factor TipJ family phage tail protein [Stenotrophomonas bentonitica]|uniref:host specificity factor TipJ family phage tail protein n=1 Tax=Stenotrophomonas bentonitica TaxID=1450134 RepID=UPI0036EA9B46